MTPKNKYRLAMLLIWLLMPIGGVFAFWRGVKRGFAGKAPRGR